MLRTVHRPQKAGLGRRLRARAQLYTEEFYRGVVKRKLAPDGVFVTQSGPAGVLSCGEVFTAINTTIAAVFPRVVPYTQHIPSYVDTWVRPARAQLLRGRRAADLGMLGSGACRGDARSFPRLLAVGGGRVRAAQAERAEPDAQG